MVDHLAKSTTGICEGMMFWASLQIGMRSMGEMLLIICSSGAPMPVAPPFFRLFHGCGKYAQVMICYHRPKHRSLSFHVVCKPNLCLINDTNMVAARSTIALEILGLAGLRPDLLTILSHSDGNNITTCSETIRSTFL